MDRSGNGSMSVGVALMVALRMAEPLLSDKLLNSTRLMSLLGNGLHGKASSILARYPLCRFSLGGMNETASLFTAMIWVAAIRHSYWFLFTRTFSWTVKMAITGGIYNVVMSAINALLLVYSTAQAPTTFQRLGPKQYIAIPVFLLGILLEIVPEETRKRFKKDPRNKGKLDNTGAWGYVRHVNYTGHMLWRTAVTLSTGKITATILQALYQFFFFKSFSVPDLDGQMTDKYKSKWIDYKSQVPYALIPGIF